MNFDANAVFVRADSPIKSAKELLEAAKANPGKLKASGTGQGGIWHLGLPACWSTTSCPATRSPGCRARAPRPGLQDLVAGGVDVVSCSLPEARSLIDAGKVRPLVLMAAKPDGVFPEGAALQGRRPGSEWNDRRLARHRRRPRACRRSMTRQLAAALKKIYDGKAYQDFLAPRGFGALYADREDFAKFMAEKDAELRRGDEGRRHRQVAARQPSMRIHDSLIGARRCCVLALAVLWHVQGFRRCRARTFGPALFPGLIAARPRAVLALALIVAAACAAASALARARREAALAAAHVAGASRSCVGSIALLRPAGRPPRLRAVQPADPDGCCMGLRRARAGSSLPVARRRPRW